MQPLYKHYRSIGCTDSDLKFEILETLPSEASRFDKIKAEDKYIDLNDSNCLNTYKSFRSDEEMREYSRKIHIKRNIPYVMSKENYDKSIAPKLCPICSTKTSISNLRRHKKSAYCRTIRDALGYESPPTQPLINRQIIDCEVCNIKMLKECYLKHTRTDNHINNLATVELAD